MEERAISLMVAVVPISNAPAAISLNGNEEIPAVQAGTRVRLTVGQIIALAVGVSLLNLTSEQLTVNSLNTLSHLTFMPAGAFSLLVINGQVFLPVGSTPAYSITGQVITWNIGTTYSIQTTDSVYAVYMVSA